MAMRILAKRLGREESVSASAIIDRSSGGGWDVDEDNGRSVDSEEDEEESVEDRRAELHAEAQTLQRAIVLELALKHSMKCKCG